MCPYNLLKALNLICYYFSFDKNTRNYFSRKRNKSLN